jgi:hypothetical protein
MTEHLQASNDDGKASAHVLPIRAPEQEAAHAGPDAVAAAFFEAKQALVARAVRGEKGRFAPANGDALGPIGDRSAQLAPMIDAWVADEEAALLVDLGGAERVSRQQRAVVLQLAKAQVKEAISWRSTWDGGGRTSSKGHTRKIAKLNEEDSDRVVRFAEKLGLERRAQPVRTPLEALRGVDE